MPGKSLAEYMEVLRLGESTLVRLQRHMLGAVWFDALALQAGNQWGEVGPQSVVLEGDEKRFKSDTTMTEGGELMHRFALHHLHGARRLWCTRRVSQDPDISPVNGCDHLQRVP